MEQCSRQISSSSKPAANMKYWKIQVLGYSPDNRFVGFNLIIYRPKQLCVAYGFYNLELGVTYIRPTFKAFRKYKHKYIDIAKFILATNDWDDVVYTYGCKRIAREAFDRIWERCKG